MTATTQAPESAPATAAAKPVAAPTRHLSILSPRTGAHTGPTLTVRVAISGGRVGDVQKLRYVLDRRLTRSGSTQLTFHGLAPGRHRLDVLMTPGGAQARTTFTVLAPRPVAVVPPVEAAHTTPVPAQPTRTTSTTTPPRSAPQQTKTTTPAPPPKASPPEASPPEASGGIPQGGGGDGDGDNSGGPSDGDGNV